MSGFKGDILETLIQKFLSSTCFPHSARIYLQMHIQEQNTMKTGKPVVLPRFRGPYRGTDLFMQCLLCRLMKHLLKTDLLRYRVANDTSVPRAGSALRGVKDYRGRKNHADTRGKLKIGTGEGIASSVNRGGLGVLSYQGKFLKGN